MLVNLFEPAYLCCYLVLLFMCREWCLKDPLNSRVINDGPTHTHTHM